MSDPKRLGDCLRAGDAPLSRLIAQAESATRVNTALAQSIRASWIDSVRFIKLQDQTAIVLVSSAAALTALRFQQKMLLEAISRELGRPCTQLQTKVAPSR